MTLGIRAWRETLLISAISLLVAGGQWINFIAIGRFSGPADLGLFALAQALITPASYLAWLSSRQQILASTVPDGQLASHFLARFIFPILVYAAVYVIVSTFEWYERFLHVLFAVIVLKYTEGIFDIVGAYMQKRRLYSRLLLSASGRALFGSMSFSTVLYISSSILIAAVVSSAVALCWSVIIRSDWLETSDIWWRSVKWPFDFQALSDVFFRNLSLGLAGMIMALGVSGQRLVLQYQFDVITVGHFAACYQFIVLGGLCVGAYGQVLLSRLGENIRRKDSSNFWKLVLLSSSAVLLISMLCATAALIIGDELLKFVYGAEFAGQERLFASLVAGGGLFFVSSLLAVGGYAIGMRHHTLLIFILSTSTMLFFTWFLAPYIGPISSAVGIAAGAVIQGILYVAAFVRYLPNEPPRVF